MTAQKAFRALMRDCVAPPLRAAGFQAAAATWRLSSPRGTLAIVNVQKSWDNDGDEVNFYVNLAVLPLALWDFEAQTFPRRHPARPMERDGLLRKRLNPPSPAREREGWVVRPGDRCGEILRDQLERVTIPELRTLLDPGRLATALQNGGNGWWTLPRRSLGAAFALADSGLTDRLQLLLMDLEHSRLTPADTEKLRWLRRRALKSVREQNRPRRATW